MKRIAIAIIPALLLAGCGRTAPEAFDTASITETSAITAETTDEEVFDIKISEDRALEIASEYLNIKPGDIDEHSGFPYGMTVAETPSASSVYYKIVVSWLVDNHHWSTVCEVFVDGTTGECKGR